LRFIIGTTNCSEIAITVVAKGCMVTRALYIADVVVGPFYFLIANVGR